MTPTIYERWRAAGCPELFRYRMDEHRAADEPGMTRLFWWLATTADEAGTLDHLEDAAIKRLEARP